MADDALELDRRTLVQTTGVVLAYTSLAVFTTNDETVLSHRFDYNANPDSNILPFPEPAVINGFCQVLPRRGLAKDSGLIAYVTLPVFNSFGIPAPRVPLPVLYDIDDCQIIVRGGAFDLGFSADLRNGLPPHGVQFTNESQTPIEIWHWDFGDGYTSTQRDPYHIYLVDGNFDVTLRAGSAIFGFAHITKYEYIIVGVRVIIDPLTGKAPLTVRFRFDKVQLG
ncbi:MAG TPA: PKD domain-containing protein [Bacteroidales bacterium]|nr:PKD domain-containing protein [Bacteroidales bacterium]